MNLTELELDEWIESYKPQVNHLDEDASFDDGDGGIMYETYGPEHDYVCSMNLKRRVWTYIDGEDGTYIVNGYSFVNRIGYFVAEIPYSDDEFFQIRVDDYRN